jgi:hypothetical protein
MPSTEAQTNMNLSRSISQQQMEPRSQLNKIPSVPSVRAESEFDYQGDYLSSESVKNITGKSHKSASRLKIMTQSAKNYSLRQS